MGNRHGKKDSKDPGRHVTKQELDIVFQSIATLSKKLEDLENKFNKHIGKSQDLNDKEENSMFFL